MLDISNDTGVLDTHEELKPDRFCAHLSMRPPLYADPAADSFENGGADVELLGCFDDGEVKVGGDVVELHLPSSLPLQTYLTLSTAASQMEW